MCCGWAENILNGGPLKTVDVSDVISDEMLNEIIDKQTSLFDFIKCEGGE